MEISTEVLLFNDSALDLTIIDGKKAFSAEVIGRALEYVEPRIAINKIFNARRNEFKLDSDYSVTETVTEAGKRQIIVFFLKGVIKLCMFSGQPRAIEFREWASQYLSDSAPQLANAQPESEPKLSKEQFKDFFNVMEEPMADLQTRYIALLEKHNEMLRQMPSVANLPNIVRDPTWGGFSKPEIITIIIKRSGINQGEFAKYLKIKPSEFSAWLLGRKSSKRIEAAVDNFLKRE